MRFLLSDCLAKNDSTPKTSRGLSGLSNESIYLSFTSRPNTFLKVIAIRRTLNVLLNFLD
jgi:hypothetical protein